MNITHTVALSAGAIAFGLVAILNCGGYRYGIGDQAFYVPAVVQHLNPRLFPRDRDLLHAQDRFMLYDDVTASVSKATGISLPSLFFAGYLTGMVLLFSALVAIGRLMYASWWTIALLAALMTLRHRITHTGANTREAYFQPRMIAFGLGAWSVAAYLKGKIAPAIALVVAAFAVHPTTALWFAIWIGAAILVTERAWRRPLLWLGAAALTVAAWTVTAGPLRGHLARMDPLWASAMAGKDYIFPSDWNASFWVVNLAYLPITAGIFMWRRQRGVSTDREVGLLAGAGVLLCVFLASWPLMHSGVALALQLQTSRIFWMLDFLAAIYIAWLMAEAPRASTLRRAIVASVVVAAIGRGLFVWYAEHRGTPIVALTLPKDDWTDAMTWIARSTAPDAHVLADPGHAWKYGSSVRVAGERDVYLEEVKDLALALYSRDVAVESLQRIRDAQGLDSWTADQLRALASRYDLDYVVADRVLDLPLAYQNHSFRVYTLEPAAPPPR